MLRRDKFSHLTARIEIEPGQPGLGRPPAAADRTASARRTKSPVNSPTRTSPTTTLREPNRPLSHDGPRKASGGRTAVSHSQRRGPKTGQPLPRLARLSWAQGRGVLPASHSPERGQCSSRGVHPAHPTFWVSATFAPVSTAMRNASPTRVRAEAPCPPRRYLQSPSR